MTLLPFLITQAAPHDSTSREIAFCSRQAEQPERFCLADRKQERAERELSAALAQARRGALAQKREIARFSRDNGGVTLGGDPVKALEISQWNWTKSYSADCGIVGLAVATGNAGTEGVTAQSECLADRTLERVEFLKHIYPAGD